MRSSRPTAGLLAALALLAASPRQDGKETELQIEAKRLETLLIAPCCWRQPVSDHPSEQASRMKAEIRQMLKEGKTKHEILDHYVEIYGPRILSIPPQEGFGRMSFLMPVLFSLVGLAVVGVVLNQWHRRRSAHAATHTTRPPGDPSIDAEMSRRIQKELDGMDGD